MGIIFFLSHQQGASLPLALPPGMEKIGHALLYAVLAASAIFALAPVAVQGRVRAGLLVILFCLLFGISDELHQALVPGRDPSGGDLLADAAGAAIMVLFWLRAAAGRR